VAAPGVEDVEERDQGGVPAFFRSPTNGGCSLFINII
jgi:hypothetical protein